MDPGTCRFVGPCLQPSSGGQSWALAVSITTSVHLTAVNPAESTTPCSQITSYWVCTSESLKYLSCCPRLGRFNATASLGLGTGLQQRAHVPAHCAALPALVSLVRGVSPAQTKSVQSVYCAQLIWPFFLGDTQDRSQTKYMFLYFPAPSRVSVYYTQREVLD